MSWAGDIEIQLAEVERRLANTVRVGKVAELDAARGLVRVEIAQDRDGNPVLTPWLPWSERAGGIRTWSPPSVGEQVRVVSPSGEVAQGWVDPGGFSSDHPAPSDDGGRHVIDNGEVRVEIARDEVIVTRAGDVVEMRDGYIRLLQHDNDARLVAHADQAKIAWALPTERAVFVDGDGIWLTEDAGRKDDPFPDI
ncbi:phage baseplate assembly protein V [Kaustia mangrovi]|nr:phage baseplate assembly protein V [Kaustia mangrovi]